MSTDTIAILIAATGLIVALTFNIVGASRNKANDNKKNTEEITVMKTDIRYIRDNFDDLRLDIKDIKRDQINLNERMAKAETNIETLYKRTKN